MFENIGSKIKGLAKLLFWITVTGAVIGGLGVIIYGALNVNNESNESIAAIMGGVGIIVIGIIVAWLQNFLLYGYGELIDSNQKILKYLEGKNRQ